MSTETEREQVVILEVALPSIYTADLDGLREYQGEHESDSDWLLNCIGEPGPTCRLRVEVSGEKDGDVQELWGLVRGARLEDPGPSENMAEVGRLANHKLLRDYKSCEWCDYDRNAEQENGGQS